LTTRLVTLTGTGGVGKTRLAIEVARRLAEDYTRGVRFVDLASLTDPARILQAVATALEIREEGDRPLQQVLTETLRSPSLLWILNNCEHLLEACAHLASLLLGECPGLSILATSRQALGMTGEAAYRVPSLPLPDLQPRTISNQPRLRG